MKTGKQANGKTRKRRPRVSSRVPKDPFQCGYLRATRILRIAPPTRWGHYSIAGIPKRFEDEV